MCSLLLAIALLACGGSPEPAVTLRVEDRAADEPPVVGSGFHPPNEAVRTAAIGPRDQLEPGLRRAFDEAVGYVPIAPPGPDEWLANHDERGQTFEQYLRSGANLPDEQRDRIYVLPIGAFASEFVVGADGAVLVPSPPLSQLEDFAERYFQMPVEVLPTVYVEDLQVTSRNHFGRRQLLATDILRELSHRLPDDAYSLVAVTMEDLYPAESWNFVFGYASLNHRVGVYSFARYDPAFFGHERGPKTRTLILRRGVKVMAHEIGHMFGIEHCTHYTCVMNGTNHLEESDKKPLHLCPVCLRKLHHAVGFEPAARYRELGQFYEEVGFGADETWIERRLEHLAGS